jgi:hypothetical protein
VVLHAYNPSTQEAEAGRSQVWGQAGLYNQMLSQNKTKPLTTKESVKIV